jgi:CDP-diacylglycerol---glycerol-3-phosphate 3-phosphatidyltransferase
MNLPNKLTVSRFVLTVFFLWAIFSRGAFNDTLALFFFCVAGFTDFLDGRIARRRGLITNFGILMDPLADKILTCSAFVALVERHALNPPPVAHLGPFVFFPKVEAWMVVIIVSRELAITGLRLLAASKNVVLAAEGYGKHKTISQIVAIIALLVMEACKEWPAPLQNLLMPWVPAFADLALWLTVALTAISGLLYLSRNRRLYLDEL